MKYEYNSDLECFERVDGRGKKIWVTMNEAQRIITMRELGNSKGEIQSKMTFKSRKATGYSVGTILEKYESGELEIDENTPASIDDVMGMSLDTRVSNLEDRVTSIENILSELKSDCFCTCFATTTEESDESISEKVKSWLRI